MIYSLRTVRFEAGLVQYLCRSDYISDFTAVYVSNLYLALILLLLAVSHSARDRQRCAAEMLLKHSSASATMS